MTQRNLFINGLVILAAVMFGVRMWLVNRPAADGERAKIVHVEDQPVSGTRVIALDASSPGWKAIGKGPLEIFASGKADIGGLQTEPDGTKKPGDSHALVPELPYGMLVAKIGENGPPFRIGLHAQIAMKDTVYLAINDANYTDNSGAYNITINGR